MSWPRASRPLLLAALALAALTASAADDLSWSLAPGEILRYDLTPDADASANPGLYFRPDAVRLVRMADFERGGKRPIDEPDTMQEILWRAILMLPEGAKGATRVDEPLPGAHALVMKGTDEVVPPAKGAAKDGLVRLKATLSVTTEPLKSDGVGWAPGTTLVVLRTFDPGKRRLVDASYALDGHYSTQGKPSAGKFSGRVACAGLIQTGERAFLASVEEAIQRGKARLRDDLDRHIASARQQAGKAAAGNSYALGYAALGTFALLRSGVPREDLEDAFKFMEGCAWTEVYSVSLYLMCLEARNTQRVAVAPEAGGHTVARHERGVIPEPDRAAISKAAQWLLDARLRGAWTYNPQKPGTPAGDRSNSQFAVLALHVAISAGVKLDPQALQDVVDEGLASQEPTGPARSLRGCTFTAAAPRGIGPQVGGGAGRTGMRDGAIDAKERGFGYGMNEKGGSAAGNAYGSMTAAGVSSLVIAREALRRAGRLDGERDEKTRRAIHDGIAWLAGHFAPGRNPPRGGIADPFYWLYSVEKAMELSGCESLAGHVWWLEGAAAILALEEKGGGRWNAAPGGWGSLESTGLALLFLNRATIPARIAIEARPTVSSGKDDPSAWDLVKVEGTGFVHTAQVLDALCAAAPEDAKEIARTAEKALDEVPEEVRPRLVPLLVRLSLADAGPAARALARKGLRAATGGLEDEAKALAFHDRWRAAARAGDAGSASAAERAGAVRALEGEVRAKDAASTGPLKRAALTSLARLRAVESLPALLDELGSPDASWRRDVYIAVVSIAGGEKRPFDPAEASAVERQKKLDAWRAWWKDEGAALVAAEDAKRR